MLSKFGQAFFLRTCVGKSLSASSGSSGSLFLASGSGSVGSAGSGFYCGRCCCLAFDAKGVDFTFARAVKAAGFS